LQLANGSQEHLAEIRRILEALLDQEPSIEDVPLFELKARLTEEFCQYPALLERAKSSLVLDEEMRILKRVIPFERELDLETGTERKQISVLGLKGSMLALFDGLDTAKVKECLVHIRGELNREQQAIIMDAIRQRLGMDLPVRFFLTRKNLEGNILVEAVCFGQGIGEQEW